MDGSMQNKLAQIKEKMETDPAAANAMIQEYLEKENKIKLNIGITGEAGSGKSTFVNALRGMSDSDEEAAPTGCVETTTEIKAYPHPNYPNVVLWDLPGVGTTKFPAARYLKHVGFQKYDFFIIISDTRFRENDVKLALEIKKMGKKFYFVRSKIDNDLRAEERKLRRDFSRERTLAGIRENCIQGLQKQGFESPQVFLLSTFELHLYDFSLLLETLERELPEIKKDALLLAMPNINLEILYKKKKAFQKNIKWLATLSAGVAAVPVPGLSVAVDLGLIVTVVTRYVFGFGLDVSSLKRVSAKTGVPFTDLLAVIRSELAAVEITNTLVLRLISSLGTAVLAMAAEEACRFIPIVGLPLAMVCSYYTIYNILQTFLNMLEEDAQRVIERVLEFNTSE